MRRHTLILHCLIALLAVAFSPGLQAQLSDVTQPGDPLIPSSSNNPGSEAVGNAIDNAQTKYLNFDSGRDGNVIGTFSPSGFVVTPSVGLTHVTGISMQSANDAPERDPKAITLEGSNDATITDFNSGNWTLITTITDIPAYAGRFETKKFFFSNSRPYRHYRWIVNETQTTPNGCCMQIAEVELLGTTLPSDVTQPGDTIFGSSANNPGSEAVGNAIDNAQTKYLNFDSGRDGNQIGTFSPSGFAVSPSIGRTLITAVSMQSANDAPERDPKAITLEGSNDPTLTGFNNETWEPITTITDIPPFAARFQTQTFFFDNPKPYRHYRWVVTETQTTPNGCCMQIAEVELLGTSAPRDVTQPGDPLIASSANNPGSEAVGNAIDDAQTKYLNFDSGRDGNQIGTFSPSGFVVTPRVGPTTLVGLTMQSANDAPERDPKAITLEGSNDDTITDFNSGNWELITSISDIPPYAGRFETKEFFFLNSVSYKHYRWIVTETQTTPNGCCMQIAEVEFLAVPQAGNTNEISTLIRRQPNDAPVLLGAQASFRVFLTGPWNVQWEKNGVPIPGATASTYSTPATTVDDDGALFRAVVSSPEGTQISDEVMLSIFTPSATESIGVSWHGGGANGAPTDMLPTDITGFQPQAYWNNLAGGTGTLPMPLTSANLPHSTITVDWATSGEWGVGTGTGDATERMLNGIATSFGTDEAGAQTVTLSGVPAGSHSLLLYTVQVPLEFFNMNFKVETFNGDGTSKAVQQRFIRPQNSDEYNPSPGFILVTSETAGARGVGNMMRFDGLETDNGTIRVSFYSPGRSQPAGAEPIRGPGLNALQLVLNAPDVGAPPTITSEPVSANAIEGGQVTLSVEAAGPNLTYQWLKNGLPIQGATDPLLTLSGLTSADVGNYSVAVQNPAGRIRSRTAVVDVVDSAELTFELIGYFKLDETSGTDVVNSAPGGENGVLNGSAEPRGGGLIGSAYNFNGSDTAIFVPNYPKVSSGITVAGWVQPITLGPLVNNWVDGQLAGSKGQFAVDLFDDAGVASFRARIETGPNQVTAIAAFDDPLAQLDPFEWHHFAMSANGNSVAIFWDGELLASTDYLGNINTVPAIPWLSIGASLDIATTLVPPPLSAILDDVALWNRSLSLVEIQGLRTGGQAGQMITEIPPVLNINRSPIAVDDTASAAPDDRTVIDVLANDSDPDEGDVLTISSITAPSHGTAEITNNMVAYTADAGYNGSDSFSYTIGDGHGGIATAVVQISVGIEGPVLINPTYAAGQFSVSFETVAGKTYTLVFKSDLNAAGWSQTDPVVQVTGDGSVMTLTDPNPADPQRFYQVLVE